VCCVGAIGVEVRWGSGGKKSGRWGMRSFFGWI